MFCGKESRRRFVAVFVCGYQLFLNKNILLFTVVFVPFGFALEKHHLTDL